MSTSSVAVKVAVVDYGLGNLFSVRMACENAGMEVSISSDKAELLAADIVVLPGVGAFGDAMEALRRLDLAAVLRDIAEGEQMLLGICLGIQLLMEESCEFGRYRGLGIIPGDVVRLDSSLKVPQVQWNCIERPRGGQATVDPWADTPLADCAEGEFMYFVHSYVVRPTNKDQICSVSRYGPTQFCSSLRRGNVFACQFHPERSGQAGLQMFRTLTELTRSRIAR